MNCAGGETTASKQYKLFRLCHHLHFHTNINDVVPPGTNQLFKPGGNWMHPRRQGGGASWCKWNLATKEKSIVNFVLVQIRRLPPGGVHLQKKSNICTFRPTLGAFVPSLQ